MARFTNRFGVNRFEADEYYQLTLEAAVNYITDAIDIYPRPEYYAAWG